MSGVKVAVLISGRGSNLQSLIDASSADDYPAEISLVISNRPGAAGLNRAQKAGIETDVIDHKTFESREAFDEALNKRLQAAEVDYICLAGFMRMLGEAFVDSWRRRIINIHPSLLPSFKGLNVHERMLAAGVKVAGCTVHFVSTELDSGPIIGQAALPVLPNDDADSLAARILELEHKLYPAALKLIASGNARLSGNIVRYNENVESDGTILNPAL